MSDKKTIPGTRKLAVGSLAGALATIIVWIVETTTTLDIPPQVTTALGTVVTSLLVYVTPEYYYEDSE